MTTPLSIIDSEISMKRTALDVAQAAVSQLQESIADLERIKGLIGAIDAPAPSSADKPPVARRPRRTKSQIAADTLKAASDAGLIRGTPLASTAHESADSLLEIPPALRREQPRAAE